MTSFCGFLGLDQLSEEGGRENKIDMQVIVQKQCKLLVKWPSRFSPTELQGKNKQED